MTPTTEHIVQLLLGFLQVIVAAILLSSFRSNKHVNIYLIFVLFIGAAKSLSLGLVLNKQDIFTNDNFNWLRLGFLVGIPTVYLYIKTIINQKYSLKDIVHFIYPLIWFGLVILESNYMFLPKNVWYTVRWIHISSYLFFYILISILLIKDLYINVNPDYNQAKHLDSIKNWVTFFFIAMVFIESRALIHFCFNLETEDGILFGVSITLKIIFLSVILIKVLMSPEILFGYPKLQKSLKNSDHDTESNEESKITHKITIINSNYYMREKPLTEFFKDKHLECLLILLNNRNSFININSLDTIFISEFKTSVVTLKKRREQSLKELKIALSFRLDIPEVSIFIQASDQIDKRIKLIKLNPEVLEIQ